MGAQSLKEGLVQLYTGDGKGKTTAALGLALRAAGHGFKVCFIQFMKGKIDYGELKAASMLSPYLEIHQKGRETFVSKENPDPEDVRLARDGLQFAKEAVHSGRYDIVVLDEINVAVDYNLFPKEEVLELIRSKPRHVELILTGRYAPQELIDAADLVTEMQLVKYWDYIKLGPRVGIEK